jgi:hypothetical protein
MDKVQKPSINDYLGDKTKEDVMCTMQGGDEKMHTYFNVKETNAWRRQT